MEKRKISDDLVRQLLDRCDAQRVLLASYRSGARPVDKIHATLRDTAAVPDVVRQRLGIPLCKEETCLELAVGDNLCTRHR